MNAVPAVAVVEGCCDTVNTLAAPATSVSVPMFVPEATPVDVPE